MISKALLSIARLTHHFPASLKQHRLRPKPHRGFFRPHLFQSDRYLKGHDGHRDAESPSGSLFHLFRQVSPLSCKTVLDGQKFRSLPEIVTEFGPSPGQSRFHSSQRGIGGLGDLLVAESLHIG